MGLVINWTKVPLKLKTEFIYHNYYSGKPIFSGLGPWGG